MIFSREDGLEISEEWAFPRKTPLRKNVGLMTIVTILREKAELVANKPIEKSILEAIERSSPQRSNNDSFL